MRARLALLLVGVGLLAGCPEHSAPSLHLRSRSGPLAAVDDEPRPPESSHGRVLPAPRPR